MDAQLIMTAIGSLGFPIVACCALFWQNYKLEQRHEDESKTFSAAIANNTAAIEKLTMLLQTEAD